MNRASAEAKRPLLAMASSFAFSISGRPAYSGRPFDPPPDTRLRNLAARRGLFCRGRAKPLRFDQKIDKPLYLHRSFHSRASSAQPDRERNTIDSAKALSD